MFSNQICTQTQNKMNCTNIYFLPSFLLLLLRSYTHYKSFVFLVYFFIICCSKWKNYEMGCILNIRTEINEKCVNALFFLELLLVICVMGRFIATVIFNYEVDRYSAQHNKKANKHNMMLNVYLISFIFCKFFFSPILVIIIKSLRFVKRVGKIFII